MEEAIRELDLLAIEKQYITNDEIFAISEKHNLSIVEIEHLCGSLQRKNILILENENENYVGENNEDDIVDRSHIDYEKIFQKVIGVDGSLVFYINELREILPPRRNEEKTLINQARAGNQYAKDRLISMFLKVVVRIAYYYYKKYGLPLADTIQDGNEGLITAVDKMPLTEDYRFSSYAPWWIRQRIDRAAVYRICDLFYLPVHRKEKLEKVMLLSNEHFCSHCFRKDHCPNLISEITSLLSISKKNAILYLNLLQEPVSIESAIYTDSEIAFSDLGKENNEIESKLNWEPLYKKINNLREREIRILSYRYGLNGEEIMTLEEISEIFGVTRERIRQIEAKSLEKLRHPNVKIYLQKTFK